MLMPSQKAVESLSGPATTAFNFWISFWPVAPMFGVEWRFADLAGTTAPGFGPSLAAVARAGAEAQERAVEAVAVAPAVAEPIADEALEASTELTEPAIEQTLETAEPEQTPEESVPEEPAPAAEPEPVAEAETSVEDVAQSNLSLDLTSDDGRPQKPKGLLSAAPKSVDDLKLIKGIGPGVERQLNDLGIYTFRQIAKFSDQDLAWVDDNLTALKGRCFRDDWIGQAKAQIG